MKNNQTDQKKLDELYQEVEAKKATSKPFQKEENHPKVYPYRCPKCNAKLASRNEECPNCHYVGYIPMNEQEIKRTRTILFVILFVIAIVVYIIVQLKK